jgi:hypothetical protein
VTKFEKNFQSSEKRPFNKGKKTNFNQLTKFAKTFNQVKMIGFNQLKFDLTTTCISQKWPAGPALATYVVQKSKKISIPEMHFSVIGREVLK